MPDNGWTRVNRKEPPLTQQMSQANQNRRLERVAAELIADGLLTDRGSPRANRERIRIDGKGQIWKLPEE